MTARILDDFSAPADWSTFCSGEARLTISSGLGRSGRALRLDFDFHGGSGFVVARREMPLTIPENYSFVFYIRGRAPANIFEFKLVDSSNRNVWRYRAEAFAIPEEWQEVRISSAQIDFAWGPLGGGPPRDVAAIELAVAAGPGGSGTVWIDELLFYDDSYRLIPLVRASSLLPGHEPQNVLNASTTAGWRAGATGNEPVWLLLDFQQLREYGALVIRWLKGCRPACFEAQVSNDSLTWKTVHAATPGASPASYLYLPRTASRYIRLFFPRREDGNEVGIQQIEVRPLDFSRSINHFFQGIAREQPAGLFPKYFQGRQTCWTPVGPGDGSGQALFNEEGMVEVDKGGFSIAPFLYGPAGLVTWTDAVHKQSLADGYLPIPSSEWLAPAMAMQVSAFAADTPDRPLLFLRYRIENRAATPQEIVFFAAILPFQVTPTWQNWQAFGGVSPIRTLSYRDEVVLVNGSKAVLTIARPAAFGAAIFDEGGVTPYLVQGGLPPHPEVTDAFGYASGALRYDLKLPPGGAAEICLAVPFGSVSREDALRLQARLSAGQPADCLAQTLRSWRARLDKPAISIPAPWQELIDTARTAAAHILINRDGPALHPGPRRYNRAWIRDGVVMGAALLRCGSSTALRDFLRWYWQYQTAEGEIPDCADRDGVEWLPEYDAYGEFIFGVMEYFRYTGDRAFLAEAWPPVSKAIAFLENLRGRRLTAEYRSPEKLARYGLLPESMSHEGYMAHPVHSYWDDFWALRGLQDAVLMAGILGQREEAARLAALRDAFRADLQASVQATLAAHHIDYIPGSVEFGDFDPTATAIAIILLDKELLPRAEHVNTFEKYLEWFRTRAGGGRDWASYSAYEIRIISALIRLGRREEAWEVTSFMLADRRIPAWNQWPEISWRDPAGPSFIGDLPHTWIGAEYILAVCSMFAYERAAEEALVIAAGVLPDWLAAGFVVTVEALPTYYGRLSYRIKLENAGELHLTITGSLRLPPGGLVVQPPLPRPIRQVAVNGRLLDEFEPGEFVCPAFPAEVTVRF